MKTIRLCNYTVFCESQLAFGGHCISILCIPDLDIDLPFHNCGME
ncbi:MAG: hypothetical protein ABIL22_04310 [candidate division WOR-3 bacterium]